MATLFNTKISQTYEGLLKTIDNAAISATLRELTDGSGNQSGLYLNTAGDFKVSAILEWGSLKDTGTGVTITRFVTSTDGLENFDNNTSLPTSAAVKLYVDTKFSQTDTLTEVLSFGNVTSGFDIDVSAGDDITFTDSSKILMGAGSDLQIYHDGNNSYVNDTGSGSLILKSNFLMIQSSIGENMINANENGNVNLYFDNALKFQTTTAGAQVTGDLVVTGTITGSGGSFLPLAGGTMTGNIVLNDNVKSIYGTASDGLEIYHDGSSSYIKDSGTGNFNVQSNSSIFFERTTGENMAAFRASNVELYYSGSSKFETTNTGVSVTGALSTTTDVIVGANATFVDNGKAIFGAGSDLQIYHDGSHSKIEDLGTGDLKLITNGAKINLQKGSSENLATFIVDGANEFFYDGTKRLETVTDGAKVTGNLEVTGTITGSGGSFLPLAGGTMTGDTLHGDNIKSIYGTGSDLEIYHDGGNSYIKDVGTGDLRIWADSPNISTASGNKIFYGNNGAAELYFTGGSKKLATTNIGVQVSGSIEAVGGSIFVYDGNEFRAGDAGDLRIGHDATNSYLKNNTGDLYINQAAVTKSIIFKTSNANALDTTALTISRNADASFGRDVTIAGDLTVNGTTTTVNSQTLAVVDPLIQLAKDNTANSLDIGLYGDYNDGTDRFLGLFSDASDGNKFKLFKGTTVEPTTTVNIGGAGYVAADLELANLEANTSIGIGIEPTSTKLQIESAGTAIKFTRSGQETYSIDHGTSGLFTKLGSIIATGVTQDHDFKVFDNVGATYVTFDGSTQNSIFAGDVGIGIAPSYALHVQGSSGTIARITDGTQSIDFYNGSGLSEIAATTKLLLSTSGTTALTINSAQLATFGGNVNLGESKRLRFGTGEDLQIYHNGSNSFISDVGTGDLRILGSVVKFNNANDTENMVVATQDASVELYYNGSKKFETTSTGVSVTGNVTATQYNVSNTTGYLVREDSGSGYGLFKSSTSNIGIASNGTVALNIDSSQNSTFAGNVNIGNEVYLDNGKYLRFKRSSGGLSIQTLGIEAGTDNVRLLTSGAFNLVNGGLTNLLNITNTGNATFAGIVGVGGTPTAGYNIDSVQDIAGYSIVGRHSSGGKVGIYSSTGDNGIGTINDYPMNFFTNNSGPQVTLTTAGNVGIGTTNPDAKLRVNGDTRLGNLFIKTSDFGVGGTGKTIYADGAGSGVLGFISTTAFDFSNGTTSRMRIDSAGNVGIGTTSPAAGLQVAKGGTTIPTAGASTSSAVFGNSSSDDNYGLAIGANSSGVGYISSQRTDGIATTYNLAIQPNGGLVGIGTTTPAANLDVQSVTGTLRLGNNIGSVVAGAVVGKIEFSNVDTSIGSGVQAYIQSRAIDSGATYAMDFFTGTKDNPTQTGLSLYNGNVGIGTTTPVSRLNVKTTKTALSTQNAFLSLGLTIDDDSTYNAAGGGGGIAFRSAFNSAGQQNMYAAINSIKESPNPSDYRGSLAFYTNQNVTGVPLERMRITSGGDVLVNNATAFSMATHDPDVITTQSFGVNNGSNTSTFGLDRIHFDSSIYYVLNASAVGVKLINGATAWSAQSDENLKENIKPLNNVLDKIKDYRCVEYSLKYDDTKGKKIGFIAQDWENDFAPIVDKDEDGLLGMKYTETIPVLLKAIQELTAKVEMLEKNCNCKN